MSGFKTYGVAAVMVIYAVTGLSLGKVDASQAYEIVLEALAIMGLRHSITTSTKS